MTYYVRYDGNETQVDAQSPRDAVITLATRLGLQGTSSMVVRVAGQPLTKWSVFKVPLNRVYATIMTYYMAREV